MAKMTNKEKVNNAYATLRNGVIELINNPNEMEQLFRTFGNNYQYNLYSGRNTMILMFETMFRKGKMFQMARGFRQWQEQFNRTVKKGEKAMYILKPQKKLISKEIDEETGEEIKHYNHYYKAVPVYELCQTEGDPIPRAETKNNLYKSVDTFNVNDFISKIDIPVEFEDLIQANGYTNGEKIVIGTHNNDLAAICTLFHELAHYHLHYSEGEEVALYSKSEARHFKELEAEAVAFMVSSAFGIKNDYSKKYISGWTKNVDDIGEEFEKRSYNLLMEALNQIEIFSSMISD